MGLMDRVDQARAKRRVDAMFIALGTAVFVERTGSRDTDNAEKIERLMTLLSEEEASHGIEIMR